MPDRDSASDSGDCSRLGGAKMNQQQQQQPSCSKNSAPEKRNRRIIMRIEFNDSDDTDEANPPNPGDDPDLDARPSCSSAATRLCRSARRQRRPPAIQDSDSDAVQRRSTRNRRTRYGPQSDDCSSSGSEIEQRPKRLHGQSGKRKKLESDEEEPSDEDEAKTRLSPRPAPAEDPGFSSDSSSNELLEKCPICLFTFRQQEIGTPATCEHIFCAPCIEAWSKNVQTCPIDRITFDRIVVRDNYADRNVVREVRVDLSKSKTELTLEEEEDADATVADVTNCEICNSPEREDVMLLCDSCNQGYHMDCLDPPLHEIPEGSWYCDECIDSNDENSDDNLDLAEDLNMLYEDIRGMGLPETRLRVREVQQQPRILRTRQNERIRAAVLRRTRAVTSAEAASGSTTTHTRTTRTTTTTTTTTRTTTNRRQTTQRRRRRRTRHRTYVVEYDLNNFDEKFALKTTSKKVIRRRRRRRRRVVASSASDETGRRRLTASKRLAEQLGVKADGLRSYLSGGNASSFTLFGNANDLEYFSDSEAGQDEAGAGAGAGTGLGATAVQTSVRIASIGNPRTRKTLLQGKARTAATTSGSSASDILSSILDLQDRWHGATRNLSEVQISADGSLNLPQRVAAPAPASTAAASKPLTEPITQAPVYQRGGAGPNFSRGGGGGGSGNRYGGNSNYNRGGGGAAGNQYQRHSSGGDGGGGSSQGGSGFSQNFNNSNQGGNNNSSSNNVSSFTPFHLRFNTPNRQQQHQHQQQRNQNVQQQQQGSSPNTSSFRGSVSNNPSAVASPATNNFSQRPPLFPMSHIPAPVMPGPGSGPAVGRLSMPAVLTVPPPPTPPASLSWNSPLFKLSTDYAQQRPTSATAAKTTKLDDDDDDADNCPNFSIYSQESQAVANATSLPIGPQPRPAAEEPDKEDDDMNEDLVQLDDDDDDVEDTAAVAAQEDNSIPLPPEKASDLYEPENPTEEQEDGDSNIDGEPMVEERQPQAEAEPETERISSNSNSNLEPAVDEDEETKTHSTPSPGPRVRDRGRVERDRGKGVLELYDDSDWEELDIDKPKEFEKALDATEAAAAETPNVAAKPAKKKHKDAGAARNRRSSDREPDRSYTPCLDEKGVDDDDEGASAASEQQRAVVSTSPKTPCSKSSGDEQNTEQEPSENIDTELISEDDLANENDSKQRRSRSRKRSEIEGGGAATAAASAATSKEPPRENDSKSKRSKRGKDETFKKVSKRPKERNYRGDKQTDDARSGLRRRTKTPRRSSPASRSPHSPRGTRSPPQPHSRSRSRSRSPSRSRSRSPIRSRNRRRPRGSRSKSYSRSRSRSRSHSNGRHGRSFRGRDFQRGQFQRGRGSLRFSYNNRNQQQFHTRPYQNVYAQGHNQSQSQSQNYLHNNQSSQYHVQNQNQSQSQNLYQRPKRRELARYDVRNVVGAGSRHHLPMAMDRYGRDAMRAARSRSGGSFERRRSSHSPAFSRSGSRGGAPSRSRSATPKRLRSFSISPSPPPGTSPHRKQQRRRSMSPGPGRRYVRSPSLSPPKQRRDSPPMHPMHAMDRGHSPISLRSGSHTPTRVNGGRNMAPLPVYHNSPRYTPRLSRSRTRSKSPKAVIKKKKKKSDKKKKNKKRAASTSPTTAARMRRISRQRDPFEDADDFLAPQKKRRHSPPISKGVPAGNWSPSPSLSDDHMKFIHDGGDKNSSWTPPLGSPKGMLGHPGGHYADDGRRSPTPLGIGKKAKRKRDKSKKKKKPIDKLQRKEKKNRKRRTQTPEPIPSKEVFASGNNILVSVSFNKEPASGTNASALQQQQQQQQQTVVTMPARHDDLLASRLTGSSMDRLLSNASVKPKLKKDKTRKRKKLDAKPVAIIDLERSPFQVHQEPADVIVLTDSEDANEAPPPHPMRRDRDSREQQQQEQQQRDRHQRRRGSGVASPAEHHDLMRENGQREKTPQADSLATIMETSSYETLQQTTGPKTPPEPPIVKFNLPAKKTHNVRNNPLHEDADDINSADELEAACSSRELPGAGIADHDNDDGQQQQPHGHSHESGTQKIGPNTPPESGPCSPDAYDPFEPTKSPSLSPRSPTPTPTQNLEQALPNSSGSAGPGDKSDSDSHSRSRSHSLAPTSVSNSTGTQTQTQTSGVINPVDLVMALMNKPNQSNNANSQQEKAGGKACDVVTSTQYLGSSSAPSASGSGGDGGHDKTNAEGNTITVLSNVLLSGSSVVSSSQHIPVISSPTPLAKKLAPLPKAGGGSVASSSSCGIANLPTTSSGLRNGGSSGNAASATVNALDDSFTMDIESPYSPGSADYEDLFEPPAQQRSKGGGGGAKTEMFDNLFGSTSPVGNTAKMSRFKKSQRGNNKGERKSRKGGKSSDDHKAAFDDLPNSATDLQNKDRFLRKLNRQERVVEEVKLVLKPHFNKKVITKEDYKDIMRRAVPKICHSRSGEINPHKIKNLIDAYVRKFRAKHKKLSLLNTGQVSSAVKCAAYLKKL